MNKIQLLIAAFRLPFILSSVLPYLYGSLYAWREFNGARFLLGLIAVVGTHLGANMINDYADAESGADNQDTHPYLLFGGSKLIQSGKLSSRFYLIAALAMFSIAGISILALSLIQKQPLTLLLGALIILLGWSYTAKPIQLSYHYAGEITLFVLFGPAIVMGAYFIQTNIFPTFAMFMRSLPFGIFLAMLLLANEVPDHPHDRAANKNNWVSLSGPERAHIIYRIMLAAGLCGIAANAALGFTGWFSLLCLGLIIPGMSAARILKHFHGDKLKLIESSTLTLSLHAGAGGILILDLILSHVL